MQHTETPIWGSAAPSDSLDLPLLEHAIHSFRLPSRHPKSTSFTLPSVRSLGGAPPISGFGGPPGCPASLVLLTQHPPLSSEGSQPHGSLRAGVTCPAGSEKVVSKHRLRSGPSWSCVAWGSRQPRLPENIFGHLGSGGRLEQGSDRNLNLISTVDQLGGPRHLVTSLNLGFFPCEFLLEPVGRTGLAPRETSDELSRAGAHLDARHSSAGCGPCWLDRCTICCLFGILSTVPGDHLRKSL